MDRGAWQAIYSPWSWKESDKHTILFLSLALIKKLYHWCRQIFSSPLYDVPNYTSNILIGSVESAVRCPLIHFVISFSETRAMFWKVHAVLKDNNLKWLRWLVPLFPYSCFCCFSNDWFCNHWVLLDKWKVFWQCSLCSEILCANITLNEFIFFSLIFHRMYTLVYSEAKMLISKFTLFLWFTISSF